MPKYGANIDETTTMEKTGTEKMLAKNTNNCLNSLYLGELTGMAKHSEWIIVKDTVHSLLKGED